VNSGVIALFRFGTAALLIIAANGGQIAHEATQENAGVADPEAFYRIVRANLSRAQQAVHEFSYKERRTTLHTNPVGKIGTAGVRLYQVYPSADPDLTYRRLVERDGIPLSAGELAKQDREFRAKDGRARTERQNETEGDRRRRERDEAQARQRAQAMIDDIVTALEFTIRGREEHEGRPAILVTFEGRPRARPKTREGRIAQKFAGMMWIDADLHEVMTVEAKSIDDISIGLGLVARLNKGAVGSLRRRPVASDLWMPTTLRLTGHGRAALFLRKLTIDYAVDWFDYERRSELPPLR